MASIQRIVSPLGYTLSEPEPAHALADLVDLADDVTAHHERWPTGRSLGIEVAPYGHVGVLQTGGEHVHSYLAPSGSRHGALTTSKFSGPPKR